MNFSTLIFIWIFLPICLAGYFVLPNRFKNAWLAISSVFFYIWGEGEYVVVLLFDIILSYLTGLIISRTRNRTKKNICVIIYVFSVLMILGYFKYFFDIMRNVGVQISAIHLPIGISFFTFQAISYVMDIYRGDAEADSNFLDYTLYISFFPQLIAGPIIKYKDIKKQIKDRRHNIDSFNEGIHYFILGLSKKVIIANNLAVVVDKIYSFDENEISFIISWTAALFYTLQIYFDFSGYSEMAIGLGKMFGFSIPKNFDAPYSSCSVSEFWRRWHISLGAWFRDYLYIPLGGSKCKLYRVCWNLFLVFLCTGIWHGSGKTFVLWGIWNGFWVIVERILKEKKGFVLRGFFSRLYTMSVVIIGWTMFRAERLKQFLLMIRRMYCPIGHIHGHYTVFEIVSKRSIIVFVISIVWVFCLEKKKLFNKNEQGQSKISIAVDFVLLLVCVLLLSGSAYNPFIYFRF